jgi:hypothetical protein
MSNTEGKTHPSAAKLNRPNLTPMKGNDVDDDRSYIRGPQSASRYNEPKFILVNPDAHPTPSVRVKNPAPRTHGK